MRKSFKYSLMTFNGASHLITITRCSQRQQPNLCSKEFNCAWAAHNSSVWLSGGKARQLHGYLTFLYTEYRPEVCVRAGAFRRTMGLFILLRMCWRDKSSSCIPSPTPHVCKNTLEHRNAALISTNLKSIKYLHQLSTGELGVILQLYCVNEAGVDPVRRMCWKWAQQLLLYEYNCYYMNVPILINEFINDCAHLNLIIFIGTTEFAYRVDTPVSSGSVTLRFSRKRIL